MKNEKKNEKCMDGRLRRERKMDGRKQRDESIDKWVHRKGMDNYTKRKWEERDI